jgi:hypothetical protein
MAMPIKKVKTDGKTTLITLSILFIYAEIGIIPHRQHQKKVDSAGIVRFFRDMIRDHFFDLIGVKVRFYVLIL